MAKTVSINDYTYSKLAVLAGRFSIMAEKPISLGMTIDMALDWVENILKLPGMEENLKKQFSESESIATPEEFEAAWDEFFQSITTK
jgi:hypothetical protein